MQPFVDSIEDLYADWTSGWDDLQDFDLDFGRVTLCRSGSEYQVLRFWSVSTYWESKPMISVDYQGSSAKAAIDAMFKAADLLTD